MALVIGPLGTVSNLADGRAGDATWNEGCIHIRQTPKSAFMSVNFDRLTGPAIAAAFYEIGDMNPEKLCLVIENNKILQIIVGFEPVFRRLCEVFTKSDPIKKFSNTSQMHSSDVYYLTFKHPISRYENFY